MAAATPDADLSPRSAAVTALRVFLATIAIGSVAAVGALALLASTFRNMGVDPTLASLREALHHVAAPRSVHVESLVDLARTSFFDPLTREPRVWYSIGSTGDIELYDAAGRSVTSGESLRPITTAIVQQLERRLKSREQERVAETERKAATARADAEIARARRSQQVATASLERRDTRSPVDPPNANAAVDERARRYDELVSDARALIVAGRYGEARAKAQRAIFVDPTRISARSLWAEAQTRLDETAFATRRRERWAYR